MTKNPAEIAGTRYKNEKLMSRMQKTVSVSAMTHPWHKESRVLCPAILFPIYRGEDSCMLQVSDVVGRRLC